jgi:hypothetical protein
MFYVFLPLLNFLGQPAIPQDATGVWIFNDEQVLDNFINTTRTNKTQPTTILQYVFPTPTPSFNGRLALSFYAQMDLWVGIKKYYLHFLSTISPLFFSLKIKIV